MTEQAFDALLHRALLAHMDREAKALLHRARTAAPAEPSRRHQKRMARMLADPLPYARRVSRPSWQRGLQRAAAILLPLVVTCAILWSIPGVQAAVGRFIRYVYEAYTSYVFTDKPTEEAVQLPHLVPAYLPEGYEEAEYIDQGDSVIIIYENDKGATLDFLYNAAQSGLTFNVDNEHYIEKTRSYNGCFYTLMEGTDSQYGNILLWLSEDSSVFHSLSGPVSMDELLKIADSLPS